MFRIYLFILIFPTILLPCESFTTKILPPIDHSVKDPSFSKFKKEFLNILKQKDVKRLDQVVDPNIHFSFGANSGKKAFWLEFELNQNPKKSTLWQLLEETVGLGFFRNEEGQFVAPYFFETFPSEFDPFTHYLVIGKNVNIREEPRKDSKVKDNLSYTIVRSEADDMEGNRLEKTSNCNWAKVCLPSGSVGFVCDRFIRSPLEYRAFFEKKKGNWVLTTFIVGD
ncbi:SH3 domain-containing protein [Leptospira sp. 96542]|nr:SH3 domain-containing protein [Leptospira sp. 96542]